MISKIVFFTLGFFILYSRAFSYCTNDENIIEKEKECNKSPGMEFVCGANICLYTEESKDYQNDFQACLDNENEIKKRSDYDEKNIQTNQEIKSCYDNLAKNYSEQEGLDMVNNPDSKLELLQKGAIALQITHIAWNWIAHGANPFTSCTPRLLYAIAAGFALYTEISTHNALKEAIKKKKNQYDNEMAKSNGYDQQLRSFEYLSEYHDAVSSAAKDKKSSYNYLATAYLGVVVAAAIELMGEVDSCALNQDSGDDSTQQIKTSKVMKSEFDENIFKTSKNNILTSQDKKDAVANFLEGIYSLQGQPIKYSLINKQTNIFLQILNQLDLNKLQHYLVHNLSLINSAHASDNNFNPSMLMPLLGMLKGKSVASSNVEAAKNKSKNFFKTSLGILTMAGANATIALLLANHYGKVRKKAKRNAVELKNLAARFASLSTQRCGQRNDKTVPQCYCYVSAGILNTERQKSSVCQSYISSLTQSAPLATNYDETSALELQGCLDSNQEFDRYCNCRQNNSCQKVESTANFGGVSAISSVGSISDVTNLAYNGKLAAANISSTSAGQGAKRSFDLIKQTQSQVNSKLNETSSSPVPFGTKLESKMIDDTLATGLKPISDKQNLALTMPGSQAPKVSLPNQSIAKKILSNRDKIRASYSKVPNKTKTMANNSGFKFPSFSKKKDSATKSNVLTFSKNKKYNYSKTNLHEENGAGLFEIITNRYKKSAFRYLNNDKNKIKK